MCSLVHLLANLLGPAPGLPGLSQLSEHRRGLRVGGAGREPTGYQLATDAHDDVLAFAPPVPADQP